MRLLGGEVGLVRHTLKQIEWGSGLASSYTSACNRVKGETSNYIIAGNARVPKAYFFIMWLYMFKKYNNTLGKS